MQSKIQENIPVPRASLTALSVLQSLVRSHKMGNNFYFNNEEINLAQHIISTAISTEQNIFLWGLTKTLFSLPYAGQQLFFNKQIIPGYDAMILGRKMMVRQKIIETIDVKICANQKTSQAKQVVIIGAGYDLCALSLSLQYPDIKFYELDQHATQKNKIKAINTFSRMEAKNRQVFKNKNPVVVNGNVHFVECDLSRHEWLSILKENGFEEKEKTIIVCEGLTMYLTSTMVSELLSSMNDLKHNDNIILLSFLSHKPKNIPLAFQSALKTAGEGGNCFISPSEVISFSAQHNLKVVEKSLLENRLSYLGDITSIAYYKANPEIPKEHYYMLSPNQDYNNKYITDINVVPDFDFGTSITLKETSLCTIV